MLTFNLMVSSLVLHLHGSDFDGTISFLEFHFVKMKFYNFRIFTINFFKCFPWISTTTKRIMIQELVNSGSTDPNKITMSQE